MSELLAVPIVAVMAGIFLLISYYRRHKMHPVCDRFAERYCQLADSVLPELECGESLLVVSAGNGALRMRPAAQQPECIRTVLAHTAGEDALEALRDLYFLRHEIQSHASNGSLAKDKYNAITNQLYDSANTFLAMINHPDTTFSQKDLDNFHYFLQKQKHIRNVTLPSIVSKTCGAAISVS